MPRPPLTKERVVSAGVVLVREVGLDALDFRAVARRVHTSPTAVQRVVSPTELAHEVCRQLLAEMPPVPERGHWASRLRQWALAVRTWGLAAPGVATYALGRRWDEPTCLDTLESLAELLVREGLEPPEAVELSSWLLCFVLIRTDLDQPWQKIGRERAYEEIGDDPVRWPLLAANVTDRHRPLEGQFDLGIDLLVGHVDRQLRSTKAR